jgi:predicted metal-dependent phosphoesterase TrpH
MPAHSSFTHLCQIATRPPDRGRADLHIHSTLSDGLFTPQEIVTRARQAGLTAIAITDHDTTAACEIASKAAGLDIEVIPGVEITAEYRDRELHLLGYFVDPNHADLHRALEALRFQRSARFDAMTERLRGGGLSIDQGAVDSLRKRGGTLGRRNLAQLLIDGKQVRTHHEAFFHHLSKPGITTLPKLRLPVAEAIELVRAAGGVSSWAHPPADAAEDQIRELQGFGLQAVECEYPWAKPSHGRKLRAMAESFGLAVTGGSDCHGLTPNNRAIGAKGISRAELDRIKMMSGSDESREGRVSRANQFRSLTC